MVTTQAENKSTRNIQDSRIHLQSFGLNPNDWRIERESLTGQIVFHHEADRELKLIGTVSQKTIERLTLLPIEFYPVA